MTPSENELWQKITSPACEQIIRQLAGQKLHPSLPPPSKTLPKNSLLYAWCQQQAYWRKRSWPRFPQAATWFWTETLLQQASDWQTALYKASLIPAGELVHDLCCGIGVDAIALSQQHPVIAIDRDPLASYLTAANHFWHTTDPITSQSSAKYAFDVRCADVTEILDDVSGWVHVDPDRRPGDKRTTSVDLMEPSLEALLVLREATTGGIIKLAPASDVSEDWTDACSRAWVGDRRHCRQQLLLWGIPDLPAPNRYAISLNSMGTVATYSGQVLDDFDTTTEVGSYICDFHPSVRASQLTASLAQDLGLSPLGDITGYLTTDSQPHHPLVDSYRVLATIAWDEKKVKRLLREYEVGSIVVKKRGCRGLDPNRLQNSLISKSGDKNAVLLLAEIGRKQIAILAEGTIAETVADES